MITSIIYFYYNISVIISLILIVFLLIFLALVSGSEIAFFSLNLNKLREDTQKVKNKYKVVISILTHPKKFLATVLIISNFLNVAISILSVFVTNELFDVSKNYILFFIVQVIVLSMLILIFGETVPKIYATHYSLQFALFMGKTINFLMKITYPFNTLLARSSLIIERRISKKEYNISKDELTHAIEMTSDETTFVEDKKILKGIVEFGGIEVKEIMKSRVDVVAVDIKTKFTELLETVLKSGYSRIPVYKETFDNVLGVLYIKDLLPFINSATNNDSHWHHLLRSPFFIPENKRINDLLREFKEKKIHLAIVVDEYGGTSGIVTLEDVIEEIVGEINDEFDSDSIIYSKLDDNNYVFEGKTTLNDFCKTIGYETDIFDDVRGESDSLAGLILELVGKIPQKNETIMFKEFIFKIESADNRRIKRIKVSIDRNTIS